MIIVTVRRGSKILMRAVELKQANNKVTLGYSVLINTCRVTLVRSLHDVSRANNNRCAKNIPTYKSQPGGIPVSSINSVHINITVYSA